MKKRPVFVLAAVIAVAVLVALLWEQKSPPQIITLPNGAQYQFVTAEWGTNQIQPTFAARFVARLPVPLANYILRKHGNRLGIVTWVGSGAVLNLRTGTIELPPPEEPAMHFWFRSLSTNRTVVPGYGSKGSLKFMLADQSGVVSGRGSYRMRDWSEGNDMWTTYGQGTNGWLTFTLPVVPRRSETLQLHLVAAGQLIETLRIQNPLFGRFPNLQPELLPATNTSGDLQVRLTDFSVGVADYYDKPITVHGKQTQFRPARPHEDPSVVFKVDTTSSRGTNETWLVIHAELSDATGNRVRRHPSRSRVTGEYSFGPALWPDEAAWRLKLTLQRICGLVPNELMTFTNVPVPPIGATNITFMTNHIQGVPIILKQVFVRNPDVVTSVGGKWMPPTDVAIEAINPPEGFVVNFEQLKATGGGTLRGRSDCYSTGPTSINLNSIPANITALDITWVVQKTRTVEFLVKPPKAE